MRQIVPIQVAKRFQAPEHSRLKRVFFVKTSECGPTHNRIRSRPCISVTTPKGVEIVTALLSDTVKSSPSLPPESVAALRDLPPSAKLVAKTLEYDGSLTQSQLGHETLLPSRTVRDALTNLEDAGVVESRPSVMDARKRVYSLQPANAHSQKSRSAAPTASR